MAGSGSYYEEYMRSSALAKHGHEKNAKKLLTDRNAYISFLEVQLERVSAACLTTQSFEARIAELEAAQTASDQKVSSLSKVFRLNQEYIEQTTEQQRQDVAGLDDKWKAWMEKYGDDMHAQQRRLDALDERFQHCEGFLQKFADETQCELKELKHGTEQDVDDIKTLVFTLETRLEGMHSSSMDTDKHLEFLKNLVTDRFDKCFSMESKLKRLELPNQLETNWKADAIRMRNAQDDHMSGLQEKLRYLHQQHDLKYSEMRDVMRKCLDTQHLLSATVVAIQNDVDEQKQVAPDRTQVDSAIDDLRENQLKLKDALRILQACTQSAQQESQDSCGNLAERLQAAEQRFCRLTEESLGKADELRTKMLVALGEVEQKLRHDADIVAEQAHCKDMTLN
uniref:Uncharacterized protein n=1 Tax=Globisporangium ultimum (strain ATCC 200006 / CBS 805.95 / DAOM BR144) TaxID=431595 RepID=K3X5Y2_GLOUD